MEPTAREPRTRVLIAVEAWWEDQTGALRAVTARMENRSEGGACIRIGIPVEVGARLGIRGRWDQFTGTARYCVPNEGAYLVGIQRDKRAGAVVGQILTTAAPLRSEAKTSGAPVLNAKAQSSRRPVVPSERVLEREPAPRAAELKAATPVRPTREKIESEIGTRERRQEFVSPTKVEPQAKPLSEESEHKDAGKKRKPMRRNWFGLSNRNTKEDAPEENENVNGNNGNRRLEATPPAPKASAAPEKKEEAGGFPVELLGIEDVYRTSGIRSPRKDYGINKVIEMLQSEHVRGLPNEMKRAAVLMALDAAGIPIDEIVRDAKVRQDALDSYETERKKQIEAEWERKAKENAQILAELETAKLQHMAAINRNLERIAREKATFGEWRAMKQQESQSISDAVALCLKPSAVQPVSDPPPVRAALGAAPVEPEAAQPAAVPAEKAPH